MKRRCYDEKYKDFPNWGGRGIKVCERWNESFEAFLKDMAWGLGLLGGTASIESTQTVTTVLKTADGPRSSSKRPRTSDA